MSDTAVHLERAVLPEVPIRHWICSFPWGVRAVLGYDAELCASAASAFANELMRSLRCRAKTLFGLGSVRDAFTGAVVAIQRTDSALRLNVHLHVLALDGVYVRDLTGALVFHPLPTPNTEEVAQLARRTAERLGRAFEAQGRPSPWQPTARGEPDPEPLSLEQPGLFGCYEAAARGISVSGERAGQPALRLVVGQGLSPGSLPRERVDLTEPAAPVAEALGISVYAKQLVDGRDRRQLERLCRYITRPPLALERLSRRADGRLELALKSIWKDGTRAVVLEPHDLLVRLCAAVPAPRLHLLRYFGILSSHHGLRSEVTPSPEPELGRFTPPPAPGDQQTLPLHSPDAPAPPPSGRSRWGWLLGHVFRADVEHCARCSGPMRWVEAATSAEAIARLLAKHGLAPRPPPPSRSAPIAPGQLSFAFARSAR